MENAGNKESRDRDFGNATVTADISGNANTDGSRIRTNDGNKSSIDGTDESTRSAGSINGASASRNVGGNSEFEIASGFYYTPRGTVERIPDGHYISADGKLRKRRKQRITSDADGDAHRDRSETAEENEFNLGNVFQIEKPLKIRGGKRGRKPKLEKETSKLTLVTMLASGSAMLFTSIAMLTKHDHWSLQSEEARTLAEALNEALNTLPEKYYAQIIAIVEKWIPWFNLAFVVSAIVLPRIEASTKRVEETHSSKNSGNDKRNARTEDNPFSNFTSLGWNG